MIISMKNQSKVTTAAAIEANLACASSDLLVITIGTLPPTTTLAAQAWNTSLN